MSLLQEGGPVFMYPLLALLVTIIVIIGKGFGKENKNKTIKLLNAVSLFALFYGLMGQVLGLIQAFDAIQSFNQEGINPEIVAGGLKISFLSTLFGIFIFLVARAGIITFILKDKEQV
jgi:Na+-driven multidrug efflux pump